MAPAPDQDPSSADADESAASSEPEIVPAERGDDVASSEPEYSIAEKAQKGESEDS